MLRSLHFDLVPLCYGHWGELMLDVGHSLHTDVIVEALERGHGHFMPLWTRSKMGKGKATLGGDRHL